MATNKIKIAVIIEDMRLQDYTVLLLVGEGYEVKQFSSQNDALMNLENDIPDLIISEFQAPNINGLDLCKILRKNPLFHLIPIFFLIPDTEPLNAARLIYAGADDYIKRSAIEDELFLKVKLNLYRVARQKQDIHPVTKLPGRLALVKELQKRIEVKESFAIFYAELFKFKEFIYRYGFDAADKVQKYTAAMLMKVLNEMGDITDFICHFQENEFVFLTLTDNTEGIANRIIKEFDQGILSFYDEEDKNNGGIMIKRRMGEVQKIPFMNIHMGVATNAYFPLFSPLRIIQIAAEIKELTSRLEKSTFLKEERKNYPLT